MSGSLTSAGYTLRENKKYTNSNWTGDDYTSTSTELQLGYEGSNWYVSGGPIVSSPDNGESSTDFIGYVGGSLDLMQIMHTQLKLVLSILSKF